MAETKKEQSLNLWKTFLQESSQNQKFQNKNILVLGKKHSGKRTLFDSLHEISQTNFPSYGGDTQPGKLRIKGISSALDYVFLKVKNLDDPDDETLANMGFYICDDDQQKNLLDLVMKKGRIEDLKMIMIMLDFEEPWVFLQELNKWIGVITDLFQNIDLDLKQLDQMKNSVKRMIQKYIFNNHEKNEEGKNNIPEDNNQPDDKLQLEDIEISEGLLENNLGIQITVVVNKSDLVDGMDQKSLEFIQYQLRKFCLQYGASLLYTSAKNNYNLDVFYNYTVSQLYDFQLKHTAELLNSECVFVPSGFDNSKLLDMTFSTLDKTQDYQDVIKPPANRQTKKQETQVVDDQEFFKTLKQKYAGQINGGKPAVNNPQQNLPKVEGAQSNEGGKDQQGVSQQDRLRDYYEQLLKNTPTSGHRGSILGSGGQGEKEDMRRSSVMLQRKAEQELTNSTKLTQKQGVSFNNEEKKSIMDLLSQNKANQKKE